MAFVRPDIVTICVGQAASMGAVLLAAGTKGKRFSLPNSRIMIHQPSMQGLAGQAADIDIYAKEILRMREILNKILADASNQTVERVARDVDRDYIMSPEQATDYGLIDRVIFEAANWPPRQSPNPHNHCKCFSGGAGSFACPFLSSVCVISSLSALNRSSSGRLGPGAWVFSILAVSVLPSLKSIQPFRLPGSITLSSGERISIHRNGASRTIRP